MATTWAEAGKRLYTVGWWLCAAAWLVCLTIWIVLGTMLEVEPRMRLLWFAGALLNLGVFLAPWPVLLIARWVSTGRWSWGWRW